MTGDMHRAGVNHRDCYICHFLLHTDRPIQASDLRLSVIDLHRAQVRDAVPRRWRDKDLAALADSLQRWSLVPTGTEGWRKAEVTAGGVDTRELSSQSLESRRVPGLHFIGEVVDVTGWLGGYNFQWAWASAAACARSLAETGNESGH